MTIAEQFASRYEPLSTDSNHPAYDDPAVMRFEQDIYEAARLIPVDPEDECCAEHLFVFSDGSAVVGGDWTVASPETVKELNELQRQWEEFRSNWFFDHSSRDRRSVFDRMECAEKFRQSVLEGSAEGGPVGSE